LDEHHIGNVDVDTAANRDWIWRVLRWALEMPTEQIALDLLALQRWWKHIRQDEGNGRERVNDCLQVGFTIVPVGPLRLRSLVRQRALQDYLVVVWRHEHGQVVEEIVSRPTTSMPCPAAGSL